MSRRERFARARNKYGKWRSGEPTGGENRTPEGKDNAYYPHAVS